MRKVRFAAAQASEIPLDAGRIVPLGPGGTCALFHHQDRWYAVGSLCPHQNAPLEGAGAENGVVTCARHGYRFDLRTGDCLTIGGYGLPVFEVEVEADTVWVSYWDFD